MTRLFSLELRNLCKLVTSYTISGCRHKSAALKVLTHPGRQSD